MKSLYESLLDDKTDRRNHLMDNIGVEGFLQDIRTVFGKLNRDDRISKRTPTHLGEADVKKLKLASILNAHSEVEKMINQLGELVEKSGGKFERNKSKDEYRAYFGVEEWVYNPIYALYSNKQHKYNMYKLKIVLLKEEDLRMGIDELRIAVNKDLDGNYEELLKIAKETNILYK